MSSILRALKKLEDQSLSGETSTGGEKVKMRQLVERRHRTPKTLKWVFLLSMGLLVSVLGLLLLLKSPQAQPKTKIEELPRLTTRQQEETARPVAPIQTNEPPLPIPTPDTLVSEEKETPPRVNNPTLSPEIPETQPVQSEPTATIAPQTPAHPNLVLNGTLWAEEPERRVALINDRYLKEGDEINGVTIVQIDKNSVILSQGQQRWTLTVKK